MQNLETKSVRPTGAQFHCIVCTKEPSQGALVYAQCKDTYMGKPYLADYYRCEACHLVQQTPMPKDVSSFYDAYPIHRQKSLLHRIMRGIVMAPVYYQNPGLAPGCVLLDYGCGDGWFLEAKKSKGLQLIGFESNQAHAGRLTKELGIPVFYNEDQLLAQYRGKVDVVTMHFVLEHLADLDGAFARVKALLKPGGEFFFVVPHFDSAESRMFKKNWHNLDSPRHLSFPDTHITQVLASRHGLTLTKTKSLPFPNGFAASLPVVMTGRFQNLLFLLFLPLGILFSRIFRDGVKGYWLKSSPKA